MNCTERSRLYRTGWRMPDLEYIGGELAVFKHAENWKRYYGRMLAPYLGDEVLEVGAGVGANTGRFCGPGQKQWVCLEPDAAMAGQIAAQLASGNLPPCCEAVTGTVQSLAPNRLFSSVLYIDVLEHIQNDAEEVQRASALLRPAVLVVLSPAHQFLFSPFDASIGHFRRYNRRTLVAAVPLKKVVG